MNELPISNQLVQTTVRIECSYPNGSTGIGTGFLFDILREEGRGVPVLITNKHLVENSIDGRLILPFKLGSHGPELKGKYLWTIKEFRKAWRFHPDEQIDLCAMPVAEFLKRMTGEKKAPCFKMLDASFVPSEEELSRLTAIEDIVMIGYPIGLWDAVNNLPMVRRGITATHPAINYNGRQEFMIDAACFPGSSGSPVFLYNIGSFSDGNGLKLGSRVKLLGVLYAGPQQQVTGEIKVVKIPTASIIYSKTAIPINLGIVIKASRILDFEPICKKELGGNRIKKLDSEGISR